MGIENSFLHELQGGSSLQDEEFWFSQELFQERNRQRRQEHAKVVQECSVDISNCSLDIHEDIIDIFRANKEQITGPQDLIDICWKNKIYPEVFQRIIYGKDASGQYIDGNIGRGTYQKFVWYINKEVLEKKVILSSEIIHNISQKAQFIFKSQIPNMSDSDFITWDIRNMMKRVFKLPQNIKDAINGASKRYNIPRNIIIAKICTESACGRDMHSAAGAKGHMQVMPSTMRILLSEDKSIARMTNSSVRNIYAGTLHFSKMLNMFDQNFDIASAAYNAGEGNITQKMIKGEERYKKRETRKHVFKMNMYKNVLDKMIV